MNASAATSEQRVKNAGPVLRLSTSVVRLLFSVATVGATAQAASGQDLQLHYDWRHAVDPRNNQRNFPALTFKTFKPMKYGSFLLKSEVDFDGARQNASKIYTEITQTLKWWQPSIFVHFEYTGGLGIFDGGSGGYYLDNAYLIGAARPFQWGGSWGNVYLAYKYTNLPNPSHDPQVSIYWGKDFRRRWALASTGVLWTQDRNRGDQGTAGLKGKRFSFLIENEIWYKTFATISIGSEIRVSENVYATDGRLHLYPTIGVRYLF